MLMSLKNIFLMFFFNIKFPSKVANYGLHPLSSSWVMAVLP